jgi:hypothetical protein
LNTKITIIFWIILFAVHISGLGIIFDNLGVRKALYEISINFRI